MTGDTSTGQTRWLVGALGLGLLLVLFAGGQSNRAEAIDAGETTTVFIADGTNYADALMGAVLAASNNAPILGVAPTAIPVETQRELERLTDGGNSLLDEIVIFGGPVAVTDRVANQLAQWAHDVRRIAGETRWGTYEAISKALPDAVANAEHAVSASDADTVDGQHAAAFAPADHHHVALFGSAADSQQVDSASGTWVDAQGMTTQVTVPAGHTGVVVATFNTVSICVTGDIGGDCDARIVVDGIEIGPGLGHPIIDHTGIDHGTVASIQRISDELGPGTYTVKVQLKVDRPADTTFFTNNRSLVAEVKLTN